MSSSSIESGGNRLAKWQDQVIHIPAPLRKALSVKNGKSEDK